MITDQEWMDRYDIKQGDKGEMFPFVVTLKFDEKERAEDFC